MLTLPVFDVLTFDVKEEVYAPYIQPVCSPYDSSFPLVLKNKSGLSSLCVAIYT